MLVLGIDVGRRHDATVITHLVDGVVRLIDVAENLPFDQQVAHIVESGEKASALFIDGTGMGLHLFETIQRQCPGKTWGVIITAGSCVREDPDEPILRVPKSILIGGVNSALNHGLVKIDCPEPGKTRLREELIEFQRLSITKSGAPLGKHDDTVLSLALALFGRYFLRFLEGN